MANRCLLPALLALTFAAPAFPQKYAGPRPPKTDVPYLLHANNLVETEAAEAREESRKDDRIYRVAGASSPAKTPLAGPIFLLRTEKLEPSRLELYRLDVRSGAREAVFSKKKKPRSIRLAVSRLEDGLYRIEVDESLENGEYSITPADSNQVFCFQVY